MLLTRPVRERDVLLEENLISQLVAEWRSPQEHGEPLIIQETSPSEQFPKHVYVIWDAWQVLSPLERSRIIMQAGELVGGLQMVDNLTLAMGLTTAEAVRLGITFDGQ